VRRTRRRRCWRSCAQSRISLSGTAHAGQPGQTSAAVRLQADRTATEPNPETVNIMRRAAVPTIIAVVGVALAGCSSSTTSTSSSPTTGAVSQPPTSTAAPLAPQDADIVATVAAIPAGSCHARHVSVTDPQAWEPDPACTPGATDGGLPLAQLCPVAHTTQIRPSRAYTDALKRAQMRAYGDTGSPATFEEDHLIPLALGGAPRDPQNLWPQPHASPNEKDTVEGATHDAVCLGKIALPDAQHRIATDWYQLGKDLHVLP
jgi:hypothetical protein